MSRRAYIAVSLFFDALLVNAAFLIAFLIRFGGTLPAFNVRPYLMLAPLITVAFLGSNYVNGLYEPERNDSAWDLVRGTALGTALGTLLTLSMLYVAGAGFNSFPRLVLAIAWPLQFVLLLGWRIAFTRVVRVAMPEQRVLIVGTNELALELAREINERQHWGLRVLGLIEPVRAEECTEIVATCGDFPVLGCVDDVAAVASEARANRVIVTSPVQLRELVESLALADETQVRIDVVPELYEIFIGTVDAIVGEVPLMQITRDTVPQYQRAVKRAIDVFGALALLVLLSPLLLVACVAILVTSGTPLLYSQERVGRNLRPFRIYKFRTMIKDAEKHSGPVLATDDDPRITRVGRFLRKTRIDELPQLWNILVGEMSFVGPRPERPFFVEQFLRDIPGYRERFHVKPGVTGLAQVSGGYATTPERKLKYDLIYMYHQNLTMDVRIIVETLQVVLTGKGAR